VTRHDAFGSTVLDKEDSILLQKACRTSVLSVELQSGNTVDRFVVVIIARRQLEIFSLAKLTVPGESAITSASYLASTLLIPIHVIIQAGKFKPDTMRCRVPCNNRGGAD